MEPCVKGFGGVFVTTCSGDRYDAEPRSRSNLEPTTTRYDEDARGPIRSYMDLEEKSFKDREPGQEDLDSGTDRQNQEERKG